MEDSRGILSSAEAPCVFRADINRGDEHRGRRNISHLVTPGEDAWAVANMHGVTLDALAAANKENKSVQLLSLREGQEVWLPKDCSVAVNGVHHSCMLADQWLL
jgi:hypothetical protein